MTKKKPPHGAPDGEAQTHLGSHFTKTASRYAAKNDDDNDPVVQKAKKLARILAVLAIIVLVVLLVGDFQKLFGSYTNP